MLMKAFILFFGVLIFAGLSAKADRFIFKGDTAITDDMSPLQSHPDIVNLREQLKDYGDDVCFDCKPAPFQAEWTIINDSLYLTSIYSRNEKNLKADINKLFHVTNGRVYAKWVTQEIWIPKGRPIGQRDMQEPVYKAEYRLMVVQGNITETKEFDAPPGRALIDEHDPEVARKTLCRLIDWSKIPDMHDQTIKVFLTFTTSESSKPENIQIVGPPEESICAQEAKRGFSQLRWPGIYRHGRFIRESFTIPIVFSEEVRKKCAQ